MPRLLAGIAIAAIASACSLIPTQIECGTVDPAICHRLADEVIGRKRQDDPGRRIVRIRITDPRGSYDLEYDDGSGESLIID